MGKIMQLSAWFNKKLHCLSAAEKKLQSCMAATARGYSQYSGGYAASFSTEAVDIGSEGPAKHLY